MFHVVQPWTNRPRHLAEVTIWSSHATAAAAFVELDRFTAIFQRPGIPPDYFKLVVATDDCQTVRRPAATPH